MSFSDAEKKLTLNNLCSSSLRNISSGEIEYNGKIAVSSPQNSALYAAAPKWTPAATVNINQIGPIFARPAAKDIFNPPAATAPPGW